MAPVARPKIEYAAGDEGERDSIGAHHPLAMLDDLTITGSDQGGGGADDPGGGLDGGSWQSGTPPSESDSSEGTGEDAGDIDAAEYAMEFQVTMSKARTELNGTSQESDNA